MNWKIDGTSDSSAGRMRKGMGESYTSGKLRRIDEVPSHRDPLLDPGLLWSRVRAARFLQQHDAAGAAARLLESDGSGHRRRARWVRRPRRNPAGRSAAV